MKDVPDTHKILRKIEDVALSLSDSIEKGDIDEDTLVKYRREINDAYKNFISDHSKVDDSRYYIIYEAKALQHWIEGREDDSRRRIQQAIDTKGDDKLLTTSGRHLVENAQLKLRKHASKTTSHDTAIGGWLGIMHLQIWVALVGCGLLALMYLLFGLPSMAENSELNTASLLGISLLFLSPTFLLGYYLYMAAKRRKIARRIAFYLFGAPGVIIVAIMVIAATADSNADIEGGLLLLAILLADCIASILYYLKSTRVKKTFYK